MECVRCAPAGSPAAAATSTHAGHRATPTGQANDHS